MPEIREHLDSTYKVGYYKVLLFLIPFNSCELGRGNIIEFYMVGFELLKTHTQAVKNLQYDEESKYM